MQTSNLHLHPHSVLFHHNQNNNNSKVHFPEDIQIIVRNDHQHHGNLFLGNAEAANNLSLLESKTQFNKDYQLELFYVSQKDMPPHTLKHQYPILSMFPLKGKNN